MQTTGNPEVAALVDQLERSFRGGAWHGPALAEVVAEVDSAAARRRPAAASHTVYELTWHVAFWLDAARKRIVGDDEDVSDADWPSDDATDATWAATLERLENAYGELRAVVAQLDDGQLDDAVSHADPTVRGLLMGLLQHNAYHAGQIMQILKTTEKREA